MVRGGYLGGEFLVRVGHRMTLELVPLLLTTGVVSLIVVPIAYIGVRGALWATKQRMKELEFNQDSIESRLNRLQKRNAAEKSVEARQDAKTITEQAQDLLAQPHAPGRPSPLRRVR